LFVSDLRGREKNGSKIDLTLSKRRIPDMLSVTETSASAPDRPKPRNKARGPGVSDASLKHEAMHVAQMRDQELSEQTQWLLAVAHSRDRAAFGRLFDFFAPRLKSMLARQGVSGAKADDIVQDVMLSVWRKAGQFDPGRAQASAWIYRIARNRHIDIVRRTGRPVPEALLHEDEPQQDASQMLAMDQEVSALRDALAGLNEEQRDVIEQAYLGELSHSEINRATGLPLGTIKSRIRLGLEKLRHELKELR